MINISPINNKMDDCLYGSILTVISKWRSIDIEMVGADAWGFEFTRPCSAGAAGDLGLIWNRVHAFQCDSWKSMETYYGVKVVWNYTETREESLSIIEYELKNSRPVLTYLNSCYCPWHPRRNEENMHFCLITGIDEENQVFYCDDPSLDIYNEVLPIGLFKQGCGPCITFQKSVVYSRTVDWRDVVGSALNRLGSGESGAFYAMRQLAKELEDEIKNCLDMPFWLEKPIPVVINVNLLQKGRIYFAITLNYLAQQYRIRSLLPIAERLVEVAKKWNSISFMVFKARLNQEDRATLMKIPAKIIEIADFEEETAMKLARVLNS
ncbi:C39 family peptidase [Hydrogeniiclostridium mannosilyticum]|uniref:C39 family peptidase n=1 Tax=Hydrogeniiclostridium mannosilyticum TaxID=2764322 RepID=UPI00399C1C52